MLVAKDLLECITLKEVVNLLKVHENTLRNWDKNGTLKAIRIGERILRRYKKEEVLKFLEQK